MQHTQPIASVVIPAYNEGTTIDRCLETLLKDAKAGELDIVVVCNGCKDDTAARARGWGNKGVRVIETEVPSKSNALNLGDEATQVFPRFYIDADIQVGIEALREVVHLLLENPTIKLSAPPARVDDSRSDAWVRAYYRVWTKLPYFSESMVGSGIYAFSKEGRARFDKFPAIISDDEFARRMASPEERRTSSGAHFTISAPRTVSSLLQVNTRVRAGMYELDEQFPELRQNSGTDAGRTLKVIARTPQLWRDAPIYLSVMLVAKLKAHKKLKSDEAHHWNRDATAREL